MFTNCEGLETLELYELPCSIDLSYSPKLSLESFKIIIENSVNTSEITITVHPDVYLKLTDEDNQEWNQVLIDGLEKNIQFAEP